MVHKTPVNNLVNNCLDYDMEKKCRTLDLTLNDGGRYQNKQETPNSKRAEHDCRCESADRKHGAEDSKRWILKKQNEQ